MDRPDPDEQAPLEAEPETLPALPLVPVRPASRGALAPGPDLARLIAAFFAGRKETTVRAYRRDLEDFTAFVLAASPEEAAGLLLGAGAGAANLLALDYKAHLIGRRLTPASVNRKLAALRSLVKLARTLGLVPWALEIEGLRTEAFKDTRGPGRAGVEKLFLQLAGKADAKAVRDRGLLHLLFDLALRRAEVVSLDLEDFDQVAGTVAVLGKGRHEKIRLTLPDETRTALAAWVAVRPETSSPALFVSLDRATRGKRLSGSGLYLVIRDLGRAAGLKVWPHGLRHAAITEALDLTGDIRAVQRFSRHRDVRVLERYDDNRSDLAGNVARQVAAGRRLPPAA